MPVTLDVIENGHVLKYTLIHPWTMDELMALQAQDVALRDQSEESLPTIADCTQMRTLASGAFTAYRLPALNHPRLGQFIVVGANPFVNSLAEMVFSITGKGKLHFFSNLNAALDFLHKQWQKNAPPDPK